MVNQVNALIFNALCQCYDVFMPEVGTLVVQRSAAVRTSKKRMMLPSRRVSYTTEPRGKSVVELISIYGEVDNQRAEDIYRQWLAAVRSDGVVTIEGVGVVKGKEFMADKSLLAALNPMPTAVALNPRTNWLIYCVAAVCVVFALGLVAYTLLPLNAEQPTKQITPTTASVTVETQPVVEQTQVAEESVTTPAVQEPIQDDVHNLVSGCSYAVYGVYSQKENALKYKQIVERRYSQAQCQIFHYREGTMFMLSVAEAQSRSQCAKLVNAMRSEDDIFEQVWIYTEP